MSERTMRGNTPDQVRAIVDASVENAKSRMSQPSDREARLRGHIVPSLTEIRERAKTVDGPWTGDTVRYLLAELDRLERALREYGDHVDLCASEWPSRPFTAPCTCGLQAALEGREA